MELSNERKGEIALLILKSIKKSRGIVHSVGQIKEEILRLSKDIGISEEEATAFAKDFLTELLTESLDEISKLK